jgi:hypothetical protein
LQRRLIKISDFCNYQKKIEICNIPAWIMQVRS